MRRLITFYHLTRTAHSHKGRLSALWFAWMIQRRVRRRERQEGKLPIRFEP